jgi:phasin family protein
VTRPSGNTGTAEKGDEMKTVEDMQKFGKDNVDATLKSFGAVSKNFQAIAVEMADYSKKAFEEGAAAAEKLLGAKSLEKAVEVQSEYIKAAYEGFVSETTKLGELYSDLAQEVYKPFEQYVSKVAVAK